MDPNNLSDDQIQQLMEAGVAPDRIQALKDRIRTDSPTAVGRMVGNVYVGASPLQFLNDGINHVMNERSNRERSDKIDSIIDNIASARGNYAMGAVGRLHNGEVVPQMIRDTEATRNNPVSFTPTDHPELSHPDIMDLQARTAAALRAPQKQKNVGMKEKNPNHGASGSWDSPDNGASGGW
jgi:hypothetical protein